MKTYIETIEKGVQIRIFEEDINMDIYYKLTGCLDRDRSVQAGKKNMTFETPIYDYVYKEIPFSVLFDELCDETFVFVEDKYSYDAIVGLIESYKIS